MALPIQTSPDPELHDRIRELAKHRNAVILAHNYERSEVQDVADFVGDSLGLSREAAKTEADTIVRTAERQIQLETARAVQQIRHEAADLSVMIASKLLQRNLSKEDNQRLIDEALTQVEARKH